MSTGLSVFDTTVQQSNVWLIDIEEKLPPCDRQQAYGALRAVSHALRDQLPLEGVVSLSAQLPMLLRGLFLEGWRPSAERRTVRDQQAFVDQIAAALPPGFPRQPNEAVRAVFAAIADQVSVGEVEKMLFYLPEALRAFWPPEFWADAGRSGAWSNDDWARFVERRPEPRSFATIDEIDARDRLRTLRAELRASPRARNQQSGSPGLQHTVGRGSPVRDAKQDFVRTVAERAARLLHEGHYQRVVIAAPDRLLGPLRRRLEETGAQTHAINRDLTKTADSALAAWLETAGGQPPS